MEYDQTTKLTMINAQATKNGKTIAIRKKYGCKKLFSNKSRFKMWFPKCVCIFKHKCMHINKILAVHKHKLCVYIQTYLPLC